MEINFGTNYSKCNIIFDVNGNYTINNANMRITSANNWNGRVAFPNGITWARVDAYVRETTSQLNAFNAKTEFPNTVISLVNCFSQRGRFNKPVNIPNSVTNTTYMFTSCPKLNQNIQIPNSVTSTASMFTSCSNLNQNIQIPNSVKNTASMFNNCPKLNQNIQIPNSVTNTTYMFNNCSNLNQNILVPSMNTSTKNAWFMFRHCNNLSDVSLRSETINNKFTGAFRFNNSQSLNIWTDLTTVANLITTNIIHPNNINMQLVAQILPTWTTITNGYYNELYNVYIYTNAVFPS